MKTKELIESGLINRNKLAAEMYPGQKNPGQFLYKKLAGRERQHFNSDDRKKIEKIFARYM